MNRIKPLLLSLTISLVGVSNTLYADGIDDMIAAILRQAEQTCSNYASNAVLQYQRSLQADCRFPPSPRWQANYHNHYGWCYHTQHAKPEPLAAEQNAREADLNACYSAKIR